MQTQDAQQLLAEGRLAEALSQVQSQIRGDAANPKPRVFLFQLLCVIGQWERAMTQLNVLADMDPGALLMVRTGAAAINCELFRREVFRGEKEPLIFGKPDQWVGWLVAAHRMTTAGQTAAADELRAKALDAAPAISGTINDKPFEWIADADGRLGPLLEVILEGRYYWVPFYQVRDITIEKPVDLRDLVWSPARFVWANGGDAVGFIPTRYVGSDDPADPAIALARKTDWTEQGSLQIGKGQRLFATDADDYAILETRTIRLNLPPAPASELGSESEGGAS